MSLRARDQEDDDGMGAPLLYYSFDTASFSSIDSGCFGVILGHGLVSLLFPEDEVSSSAKPGNDACFMRQGQLRVMTRD